MCTYKLPEPTVGALVFNPQDQALFVRAEKWSNKFVVPGGHVEMGETLHKALEREIAEETGLRIYDTVFIGTRECIFPTNYRERRHFIFFDFACKTNSTDVTLNEEAQEAIWCSLRKLRLR